MYPDQHTMRSHTSYHTGTTRTRRASQKVEQDEAKAAAEAWKKVQSKTFVLEVGAAAGEKKGVVGRAREGGTLLEGWEESSGPLAVPVCVAAIITTWHMNDGVVLEKEFNKHASEMVLVTWLLLACLRGGAILAEDGVKKADIRCLGNFELSQLKVRPICNAHQDTAAAVQAILEKMLENFQRKRGW